MTTVDSFKSGGQNAPAAADALAAMNRLKQSIPAYVRDLQANDPRRIHTIALLENFSPDTARALSDEIRAGNARQFNNDPAVDVGNDFLAGLDGNVEEQKGCSRISRTIWRLAAMPGVGTVNDQVRNIRVEDIAAGNQQNNNGNDRRRIEQGAENRRNLAAHQRQNNDQNGPVAGGNNYQ